MEAPMNFYDFLLILVGHCLNYMFLNFKKTKKSKEEGGWEEEDGGKKKVWWALPFIY